MSTLIEQIVAQGKLPTVKEELERDEQPRAPPPNAAFVSPRLEDYTVDLPQPGIHFNVPDEVYHSWPALSCSGIRKLAASPTLFYMTTPWLNPDYEQPEEKAWANIGKAYHARILEGREAFNDRFCVKLEKSAIEGLCVTIDDIKARIDTVHGKVPFGKKKEDFVAQLLELEPDAPLWEECQRRYDDENGGKCQLPYDVILRIETAAKMIELHPEISRALSGGWPEVSLFWYCRNTGVPMKMRADYMKTKLITDLKSLENKFELSPEMALRKAIANNRYTIQPSVYLEGAQAVKEIVREHGRSAIFVHGESQQSDAQTDWALKWAEIKDEPEWCWIFQMKGVAPITRGVFYPRGGTKRLLSDEIVSRCKKLFRKFSKDFGVDIWLDIVPMDDTFSDEDIPDWAVDI